VRASENQAVQHAPGRPAGLQKDRRRRPTPDIAYLGPAATALITSFVAVWNISGPSFTRDEGATLLAAHRTFPQLVQMLGRVDVVHGAYYTLIWAVTRLAGSSEFAVRFPSAVAMAGAAAAVTALGHRLVSVQAGLAAGLVMAVLPSVSWYAEDARDPALATGLGALSSYLLVRALEAGPTRRRWLAAYGVALAALGLAGLFSLLIIPAHAVAVTRRLREHRQPRTPLLAGWLAAVIAAVLADCPVAVTGYFQLHQIHWLRRPGLAELLGVARLVGPLSVAAVLLLCMAGAVAPGALHGAGRLRRDWPSGLVAVAVPWLVLPPAILLAASLIHPVYTIRYIAFCIPAAALLAGAALAALGQVAGLAALVAIAVAGLPAQIAQRAPGGHGFNIRRVEQIVAWQARPGDAVLNLSTRTRRQAAGEERGFEAAYPHGLADLRDISQGATPARSGTLGGTFAPASVERQRLASVSRLWVVSWRPQPVQVLRGLGFTRLREWHVSSIWIRLFIPPRLTGTGERRTGRSACLQVTCLR